ncbi:hypothetical protein [Cohnella soli]|uniref:Major facilitator superfamily (MFS) profile domain-containing protein n=1 Tax=Cohnella soli TaxID=425005 RepID=A0ABW0HXA4_9BACL
MSALGFTLIWISIDQRVWWVAVALIVMNIGYAFSQTSITESVSSTLSEDRIGIGMGIFSLGMFIAQAVGTAVAAKLLDDSLLTLPLHPFVDRQEQLSYANLTLLMILVVLCSTFMYYLFSRRRKTLNKSSKATKGDMSYGN